LAAADGTAVRLDDLAAELPTQDFDLACEELLLSLDEPLRRIALLRLMGHTNDEIARQLDCTRRKIERKLALIRLKWERRLEP
jgi:DNA-directed RNA polymerase specialized sigma24 family protein